MFRETHKNTNNSNYKYNYDIAMIAPNFSIKGWFVELQRKAAREHDTFPIAKWSGFLDTPTISCYVWTDHLLLLFGFDLKLYFFP